MDKEENTSIKESEHAEAPNKKKKKNKCLAGLQWFFSMSKPGATPMNIKVIALVIFSLFGSAYSITFLFPFLPDMVLHFGYKEEEKGYYAGLIASSMFAGRAIGSYFWGWLSDRIGRKPVIIMNMIMLSGTHVLFGFSKNLAWAMSARFLNGLLNGVVGTAKTVLYEVSDDTNQAAGMATIAIAWGSGTILGPFISGALAEPAEKYSHVFSKHGIFGQYPFLLSSLSAVFFTFIPVIFDWFFLPETLVKKKRVIELTVETENEDLHEKEKFLEKPKLETALPNHGSPFSVHRSTESLHYPFSIGSIEYIDTVQDKQSINAVYGLGLQHSTHSLASITYSAASQKLKPVHANGLTIASPMCHNSDRNVCVKDEIDTEVTEKKNCFQKLCSMNLCVLLRMKGVRYSVAVYSLMSFGVIGFDEVFSVWCSTEPRLYGLGFSPLKIGTALGSAAIPLCALTVFLYPKLEAVMGARKTFQNSAYLMIMTTTLLGCLRVLHDKPVPLWVLLITIQVFMKMATAMCFSSVSLFVNNSVEPHMAGAVNGLAMTTTAITRTLAPTISGSVFAWSITWGSKLVGFPFDVNCVFIMFGLIYLLTNVLCAFMPKSLDKQKKTT